MLFRSEHGARLHRDVFIKALDLLHTKPLLRTDMPSAGRATLVTQPRRRRHVVHLLYAPPLKRGRCLVIEDLPPLFDVPVAVRVPETIRAVRLPLTGESLPFDAVDGEVRVVVPEVHVHQMLTVEW